MTRPGGVQRPDGTTRAHLNPVDAQHAAGLDPLA